VNDRFCIDTSAWHRRNHVSVAEALIARLDADEISMCDQVRLEVLYSARSAADYQAIADELGALHPVPCDARTFKRALEIQQALAHAGGLHHRSVTIADLIIAAAAEAVGDIVWHYDEDFDRIAAVTGQRCQWIAPRGSL
jgi:predicted nucleic acid-binding protein